MKKSPSNTIQLNSVKERLIFLSPTVQGGVDREPNTNDFEIIASLGTGAFGKVYKVRNKRNKLIYAIKQISKKQIKAQKMVEQIRNEIRIMYSVNHENIIKLFTHFEEEEYIYLVIEYASGGQLWYKLNQVGRFDEETVKSYLKDIIAAVEYLHGRDPAIIHRDIKPENLLLDTKNRVKLADFGWSNFFTDTKRITYCGTLDYLAPEMILELGHDKSLDIWSLGVLIYELLTGKAPFAPPENIKDQKEKQKILEENVINIKLTFPNDFPQLAKDLLGKILRKNPSQRISLEEMKKHQWLKISDNNIVIENVNSSNNRPEKKKIFQLEKKDLDSSPINALDGFSPDELLEIINKKGKLIVMNNEKLIGDVSEKEESPKKESLEPYNISNNSKEDLKTRTINELNSKLQKLMEKLNETEIQYEKKCIEINEIKSNKKTDDLNINEDKDGRRLKLLEDEKKTIKKEFDHMWETLKERENIIQRQTMELKKYEDFKKDIEKYKSEKNQYQEKIKKFQDELENQQNKFAQFKADKEEEKLKLEMQLKQMKLQTGNISDDNNNTLFGGISQEKIIKELAKIMEDLKEKINNYKENAEESDKKTNRIQELEKELNKLRSDRAISMNELQTKLIETQEEEMDKIKCDHRKQIEEYEDKLQKQKIEYDTFVNNLRKEYSTKTFQEIECESLKKQLETTNKTIFDIKLDWETLKKLKIMMEGQIKELTNQVRDQEEIIKKFKK